MVHTWYNIGLKKMGYHEMSIIENWNYNLCVNFLPKVILSLFFFKPENSIKIIFNLLQRQQPHECLSQSNFLFVENVKNTWKEFLHLLLQSPFSIQWCSFFQLTHVGGYHTVM